MKIIVGGGFSYVPFSPGAAWTRLALPLGLRSLGHEVLIIEQVEDNWCLDRNGNKTDYKNSFSREIFIRMLDKFQLHENACQIFDGGKETTGAALRKVISFANECDLLINNSGHISLSSILEPAKRRVYIDLDPVYTQLWYAVYNKHKILDRHDVFFTVGANIGSEESNIPDCGKVWHYFPRAVIREQWPLHYRASAKCFTTISNWAGFGELSYKGKTYRPKYTEFLRYSGLPSRVPVCLEVALKNFEYTDTRIQELSDGGWKITNASRIDTLESYQQYIADSRGEIGLAQNAYVDSNSGWFSDRSAHYLACGKPVLAQATGFEAHLPSGLGLIAFRNLDDAIGGIENINGNYRRHCLAARDLAVEYFDHRKVLPDFLETCMQ